jgi:hypothetical protein
MRGAFPLNKRGAARHSLRKLCIQFTRIEPDEPRQTFAPQLALRVTKQALGEHVGVQHAILRIKQQHAIAGTVEHTRETMFGVVPCARQQPDDERGQEGQQNAICRQQSTLGARIDTGEELRRGVCQQGPFAPADSQRAPRRHISRINLAFARRMRRAIQEAVRARFTIMDFEVDVGMVFAAQALHQRIHAKWGVDPADNRRLARRLRIERDTRAIYRQVHHEAVDIRTARILDKLRACGDRHIVQA